MNKWRKAKKKKKIFVHNVLPGAQELIIRGDVV